MAVSVVVIHDVNDRRRVVVVVVLVVVVEEVRRIFLVDAFVLIFQGENSAGEKIKCKLLSESLNRNVLRKAKRLRNRRRYVN